MGILRVLAIAAFCAAVMPGETRAECDRGSTWCPKSPGSVADDTFGFFRSFLQPKASDARQDAQTGKSDALREPAANWREPAANWREPSTAQAEPPSAPKPKKRLQKRARQA